MIVESVRTLLGADLTKQVDEALKGKGKDNVDIDIVIGNDGSFIPAQEHNFVVEQHSQAEKTLAAVATTLKDLGGSGDTKNLATDVLKAKNDMDTLQSNHKSEMSKLAKTTAVKLALASQVHDPDDVIEKLDMSKIEVDDKGKLTSSLDEFIKPIKESKPYLFKEPAKANVRGAEPGALGGTDDGKQDNITTMGAAIENALFGNNE